MAVLHRLPGEPRDPGFTPPLRALPWADRALCAQTDPELFFPITGSAGGYVTVDGDRFSTAKAICGRCPVIEPCAAYAMADPTLEGVWGGMTDRERKRMRAAEGATA